MWNELCVQTESPSIVDVKTDNQSLEVESKRPVKRVPT